MTNIRAHPPPLPEGLVGSGLFKQIYACNAHVVINQGGTSSGKTFAIMQVLFCLASASPKQVVTVVGQDIPNLKAGVLRDALNIYSSSALFKALVKSYNKTDRIFEFRNGTTKHTRTNHKPR